MKHAPRWILLSCLAIFGGACDNRSESPVTPLRDALAAYEEIRAALAADRLDDIGPAASRLEASLAGSQMESALGAARALGAANDLAAARTAFGELSRALIPWVASDPRLREELRLNACPMTKTFGRWMQRGVGIDNPYMGKAMPTCGSMVPWEDQPPPASAATDAETGVGAAELRADSDVAYYTCSMHTHVRSEVPGKCPICSMDLVPVTRHEVETGEITVDLARRQEIGIRTAAATRQPVVVQVRAAGQVAVDETRLAEVSVKYGGWVRNLRASAEGQSVRRGETLFALHSPELVAAQGEYLAAIESQERARASAAPDRADYLVEAARQRLRRFDLHDEEIARLTAERRVLEEVPVAAPVSGSILEKNVVEGSRVEPGQTLFRLAGLDRVWVEAAVPESELPLVEVGQRASVRSPDGSASSTGRVSFIHPILDATSRTGRARVELPNGDLRWKPGMYVDVELAVDRGERLAVPDSAVLYTGERRIVFVDLGGGRLQPRPIEVGERSGDWIEVRSGLEEGETVVSSGTFLVAAESRVKAGIDLWR